MAAGAAKVLAPAATATAASALGVPAALTVSTARALGLAEIGVGAWALADGGAAAAIALVLAHVGFAAVTVALLRRPDVPCGCFGAPDAPATVTGLWLNLASAGAAGARDRG